MQAGSTSALPAASAYFVVVVPPAEGVVDVIELVSGMLDVGDDAAPEAEPPTTKADDAAGCGAATAGAAGAGAGAGTGGSSFLPQAASVSAAALNRARMAARLKWLECMRKLLWCPENVKGSPTLPIPTV